MALHEHRVQRPLEIGPRADACGFDRAERIEHGARPDWNPGGAQRARKVNDVLGEKAGQLRLVSHDIFRVQAFCRV
jgi:hypothetical protein